MQKEKEVHSEEEGKSHCDMQTPKPVGALIRGAKGDSSAIKYKITATPGYVSFILFYFFFVH